EHERFERNPVTAGSAVAVGPTTADLRRAQEAFADEGAQTAVVTPYADAPDVRATVVIPFDPRHRDRKPERKPSEPVPPTTTTAVATTPATTETPAAPPPVSVPSPPVTATPVTPPPPVTSVTTPVAPPPPPPPPPPP